MNVIFQIEGGLGKSIMATALVKVIKKRYKNSNLIVITAFPDVFLNNPNVFEVHHIEKINGLYLSRIKDTKCKVFASDPYRDTDFITETPISLFKTWCKIYGLHYNNEQPQIYLTQPEIDYFTPFYNTDKPILAIQPNGGPEGIGQYSWTRDIPTVNVKEIIEHYKSSHTIIHIKREDQTIYENTLQALDGFRSIAILLQLSDKRLLIDSFSQHMAAALNLKSTVCWITTKPEVFGYKIHNNIKAEQFTKSPDLTDAIYNPFQLVQDIHTIPYKDLSEVFITKNIIDSLNN
jgi:ADP-heptose:LPS heptosyltransferase|tara:strand:- start:313 stop:1185 length:873 start_codon:yes stop_codon:yes gene_type:complete